MIPRKDIIGNRVLCLFWKASKKGASRKLIYIFSKGAFFVPIARSTDILKRITASKRVEVKINGNSQACKPKMFDEFALTKQMLKRGAERLAGRKLGLKSKLMQNLNRMAAKHVVIELKPVKV
ncbi:MAG: hypothetical protein V1909_05635 [Candidatus Micrarchaeota archaeon]